MLIKFLNGDRHEITDLRGANLCYADLRGTNLCYADLRGTNLRYAILHGANLRGTNLRYVDLRYADLHSADLRYADLQGADLRYANLHGANLSYANFPKDFTIVRLDFGGWPVTINPTQTSIGCQTHSNDLWLAANAQWIATMNEGATAWWTRHGTMIQAVIRGVMTQNL